MKMFILPIKENSTGGSLLQFIRENVPNVYYAKKVSINMQHLGVSAVLSSPCYHIIVNSTTESFAADLIFML